MAISQAQIDKNIALIAKVRRELGNNEALGILPQPSCIDEPGKLKVASDQKSTASYADYTLLKDTTEEGIKTLCRDAVSCNTATVCVRPQWVAKAKGFLKEKVSPVKVCTVVNFHEGNYPLEETLDLTRKAVADGADEIDTVVPIEKLKAHDWVGVRDYIKEVVQAAGGKPVKVIMECCALTPEEIVAGCLLAKIAGAKLVKTSTGYGTPMEGKTQIGAREEDVALMRMTVGYDVGVKASGGIKTLEQSLALLAAGASRLGTSALASFAPELAAVQNGGQSASTGTALY